MNVPFCSNSPSPGWVLFEEVDQDVRGSFGRGLPLRSESDRWASGLSGRSDDELAPSSARIDKGSARSEEAEGGESAEAGVDRIGVTSSIKEP